MALTLVKEDGTGVTGANAYDTVAEFVTWLTDHAYTYFPAAAANVQTLCAIEATKTFEREVAIYLTGFRLDSDQGLHFPRIGAEDRRGRSLDTDATPEDYRHGIMVLADEMAGHFAAGQRMPITAPSTGIRQQSHDGSSVTYGRELGFRDLHPLAWAEALPSFRAGLLQVRG